jgi:tetratricopeptide (TPR) repeat protein
MTNPKNLNIFLSYGHDQNAELVEMIKRDLEKRGHDVWFDKSPEKGKGIKSGDDWRRAITDGIVKSDKVLSFLSKHSTRDPGVCRDEIAIAIGVKGGNIKTILVESETEVKPPVNIGHIQWLDMHNWKALYEQGGKDWENWYAEKLAEIISVVESDESRRFAGEIEKLAQLLQPTQSHARINDLLDRGFFGREWLFSKVEDWRSVYSDTSRVFVLLAGAGVGKSAFAAHLAHLRGDVVVAAHFCEWNKPLHSDARATVKSIAFQLATKFPDYRKYLLKLPGIDKLEQQSAAELFTFLVANPLTFSIDGGRQRHMILIDAVDEANAQNNQNELIALIADEFERTPHWLSLVVTSRPENDVLARLNKFNPRYIDAGANENMADIQLFLQHRLSAYDTPVREKAIESIVNKCEGNFLYAVEICNDIHNRQVDIAEPDKFPAGMGNLFLDSFDRKFSGLDYNMQIAPVLEILTTALEPISVGHVCSLLGMKKRELNEVLLKTGSFFPVNDGKIKPFHKSLIDWLGNNLASERYYIDPEDAEQQIAEAHDRLFEEMFDEPDILEDADEYALQFALVHIYKAGMKKVLHKHMMQIFDAEDDVYKTFETALNNLVDWVVKNKKAEHERLLKNTLNTISENAKNKRRLSYFFDHQGNVFENIGFSIWALEFFEKSLKVMEDMVAHETGMTGLLRDLSVSFDNVGHIYTDMGQSLKALEFFEKSLKVREKLVTLDPDRADFRREISWSFNNLGTIYHSIGEGVKALEFCKKSLKIMEDLVANEPEVTDFRCELSACYKILGNIYHSIGEGEKALEYFENDLKIMKELVVCEPIMAEYCVQFSSSLLNVGNIFKMMGHRETAIDIFEASLKVMEKIISIEPSRTDFSMALSMSLRNLGHACQSMGEENKALLHFKESLKLMKQLVAVDPGRTDFHSELCHCYNNLGSLYLSKRQTLEALRYFENAYETSEYLVNLEPSNIDFRFNLSVTFNNVGVIYEDMGELVKAIEFFEKSLKVMEGIIAHEPDRLDFRRQLSVNYSNLGSIYKAMGEKPKALVFFENAMKATKKLLSLEPSRIDFLEELSLSYDDLGNIYSDMGYSIKALDSFEKMINILEDLLALEPERINFSRDFSVSFNNVGNIYKTMGQSPKALEFFEKGLRVMEDMVVLEPGRLDYQLGLWSCCNTMGIIYEDLGKLAKALTVFEKSLKVVEDIIALKPGQMDFKRQLSLSYNTVGNIFRMLGERTKALAVFEKSLKVMEELINHEPERPDFQVEFAIIHWNIYMVCPKDSKMLSLNKAKEILETQINNGVTHKQLNQLWLLVNNAILDNKKKSGAFFLLAPTKRLWSSLKKT